MNVFGLISWTGYALIKDCIMAGRSIQRLAYPSAGAAAVSSSHITLKMCNLARFLLSPLSHSFFFPLGFFAQVRTSQYEVHYHSFLGRSGFCPTSFVWSVWRPVMDRPHHLCFGLLLFGSESVLFAVRSWFGFGYADDNGDLYQTAPNPGSNFPKFGWRFLSFQERNALQH